MYKDEKITLGLLGVSVLGLGALIGGTIVNKINNGYANKNIKTLIDTNELFRELLEKSYLQNDELKK